jgi:nitroreductase
MTRAGPSSRQKCLVAVVALPRSGRAANRRAEPTWRSLAAIPTENSLLAPLSRDGMPTVARIILLA